MIDVPLENAMRSVLCERLGFSFEVNNIFSTLIFSFSLTPCHRILCAKLPDGHLKFDCSVLHLNVDFYFKFSEYSKFYFF